MRVRREKAITFTHTYAQPTFRAGTNNSLIRTLTPARNIPIP